MTARAIDLEDVLASHGDDDPTRFIAIADHFLTRDDRPAAAAALDRAYGLAPDDADLARHRAAILDELAITEHGLVWRFVPAGTFVMGSEHGDPDERPVHPRRLDAFWMTDIPIPWPSFCSLMGWSAPPQSAPPDAATLTGNEAFRIRESNKIRSYYTAPPTPEEWTEEAVAVFVEAQRTIETTPMCAVGPSDVDALAAQLTRLAAGAAHYASPTEAEWEKAARGGLVGRRFAWGDAPPTRARCDFDRMGDYRLAESRALPPNGYGLYAMCGGVAEWTRDIYDALAYERATHGDFASPPVEAAVAEHVLRGGAWPDCADAVTVSRRTSRHGGRSMTPTIGMRLVRRTA